MPEVVKKWDNLAITMILLSSYITLTSEQFRWNAVFVLIFFASVLAKFCSNQNLELIRSIAAQFSTSTNIQACLISTWLCLQIDTLKCILLYLFFTHSSLSNVNLAPISFVVVFGTRAFVRWAETSLIGKQFTSQGSPV